MEYKFTTPYARFQEWLDQCPVEIVNYADFTDTFDITFHFLRNNTEINCQFEDLSFYTDTMSVEFTIQDAYDGIEKVMF